MSGGLEAYNKPPPNAPVEIQWSIRVWEKYVEVYAVNSIDDIPAWLIIVRDRYCSDDGKWRGE